MGNTPFSKKSISNNSNVYHFNTLPTPVSTFSSTFVRCRPKCPFAFPQERCAKGPFGICRPRLRVHPLGPRQGLSGAMPPLPGLLPLLLPCCPLQGLSFPTHNLLPAPGPGLGSGHTVRRLAWHGQAITQTCVCQDSPRPLGTVPSVPRSSPTTPSPITGAPRRGPAMGMVLDAQPGPAVLGKGGLIGKTRPSWKTQSRERSLGVRGKWRGGA